MITVYFNKVFNPCWTSHDFISELALLLKDKLGAKLHMGYGWQKGPDAICTIKEFDCPVPDCEIVIHDSSEDSFKVLSFSEIRTKSWDKILSVRNNSNDILITAHGNANWGFDWLLKKDWNFKIYNHVLYTFDPKINYSYYYRQRRLLEDSEFLDKLYFVSTTKRGDEQELQKHPLVSDRHPCQGIHPYLSNIIKYKVGLSLPGGTYEMCHRDIEYLSIGLPMMRLEYLHQYEPELKPNFHYISIDRLPHMRPHQRFDYLGGPEYRELYINRFKEVKDDKEFLKFISNNGREYYNNNISEQNRMKIVLNKFNYEI